jgi:hypothetical protein
MDVSAVERSSVAVGLVSMALTVAGCSQETHDASDGGPGAAACASADDFRIGMQKASSDAAITVALANATPAPPAMGANTWTIQVNDASGAPIEGADVEVSGWMPEHSHGLNTAVTVTELERGSYRLDPIRLIMPSLWQITISVTQSGGETASVMFAFCVATN